MIPFVDSVVQDFQERHETGLLGIPNRPFSLLIDMGRLFCMKV